MDDFDTLLTTASSSKHDLTVVLLTGADRVSIDAVAFSLLDDDPHAMGFTYDVRADEGACLGVDLLRTTENSTASGLSGERRTEHCEMGDCCLTCSVKHDLGRQLQRWGRELPGVAGVEHLLVALPVGVEATPVIQYLRDSEALGEFAGLREIVGNVEIGAIVNAVGLDEFEERLLDDGQLCVHGTGQTEREDDVYDERSTGVVVSRLIHEADHVLELSAITAGYSARRVAESRESRCRRMVAALAHSGAVVHSDAHGVGLAQLSVPRTQGVRALY